MNKKIIPIIVILIIATGIGAYFIFQKPAFPLLPMEPQSPADKCPQIMPDCSNSPHDCGECPPPSDYSGW